MYPVSGPFHKPVIKPELTLSIFSEMCIVRLDSLFAWLLFNQAKSDQTINKVWLKSEVPKTFRSRDPLQGRTFSKDPLIIVTQMKHILTSIGTP